MLYRGHCLRGASTVLMVRPQGQTFLQGFGFLFSGGLINLNVMNSNEKDTISKVQWRPSGSLAQTLRRTRPSVQPVLQLSKDRAKVPRRKKNRLANRRPEVVLIKPAEVRTFTKVLGKIHGNVSPVDVGAEIRAVRKTRGRNVLVEFGRRLSLARPFV